VTVGTDGFGLISYWDSTNGDLKVAHCTNLACTAATATTIDSTGNVGGHTSVTVGTDGFGLISYHDATNADLKVAHCTLTGCPAYAHNR
jgi:preprotein translocase subunit Sec61beta